MPRFIPVKELVQNQLMRLPMAQARGRASHNTGIQQNAVRSAALFDRYCELLPAPLPSLSVMELGPGRGTGMMRLSCEAGVKAYAAFDIDPYLEPAELPDPSIDYRWSADGRLPWDDDTFDLVWSHSVLEHLRDPIASQRDVMRVVRPGGHQIAEIDFQDHYQPRKDPAKMYNMLRYSDRAWDLMTSNRSSWTNRLRYSDWVALFAEMGWTQIDVVEHQVECDLEDLRAQPYLAHLSDQDLSIRKATFLLQR